MKMVRAVLTTLVLVSVTVPVLPQTPHRNPLDKVPFFGDMLALIGFCGLHHHIDQYEMAMAMSELGVTAADRPALEAVRDKNYEAYREKYSTAPAHGAFCIQVRLHPFFEKVAREGSPTIVGSDTTKQPEKIELFGNLIGTILFCKMDVDSTNLESFFTDMGVLSESMNSLKDKSLKVQQALLTQYGTPERAIDVCNQLRANPTLYRLEKR